MNKDDGRPDPEDLLARYGHAMKPQIRTQGRLRIYLGAAPGVGKTFAMLAEGHRLRREGHDVVAGVIETHGRAETAAQIGTLDQVPLQQVAYRGVAIAEMDVDAILKRAPAIVLVDELAHTNAPGSKRQKRWQDVEILRAAGIDVIATLNVQHLEGLNHVVESITGVKVRETVPDSVLAAATEVQLVDLPVEGLLERLEAGKIYPPERANQALQHFFREGNLTALRELALRQTAAGVDERLEQYMHEHDIAAVWPAAERIAVAISDQPANAALRAGWRLASVLRSELIAVLVVPAGGVQAVEATGRERIERNIRLAEDLGGTVKVIEADNIVTSLAAVVHDENVNVLVMGSEAARSSRWRGSSTVDRLFKLVDNVHVLLVEERERG